MPRAVRSNGIALSCQLFPPAGSAYQSLLQPDSITVGGSGNLVGASCCGEADAYYVNVYVRSNWQEGQPIIAIIDDDRDDKELQRIPEKNGTQYVVHK